MSDTSFHLIGSSICVRVVFRPTLAHLRRACPVVSSPFGLQNPTRRCRSPAGYLARCCDQRVGHLVATDTARFSYPAPLRCMLGPSGSLLAFDIVAVGLTGRWVPPHLFRSVGSSGLDKMAEAIRTPQLPIGIRLSPIPPFPSGARPKPHPRGPGVPDPGSFDPTLSLLEWTFRRRRRRDGSRPGFRPIAGRYRCQATAS